MSWVVNSLYNAMHGIACVRHQTKEIEHRIYLVLLVVLLGFIVLFHWNGKFSCQLRFCNDVIHECNIKAYIIGPIIDFIIMHLYMSTRYYVLRQNKFFQCLLHKVKKHLSAWFYVTIQVPRSCKDLTDFRFDVACLKSLAFNALVWYARTLHTTLVRF